MKEFIDRLFTVAVLVTVAMASIWGTAHCVALLSMANGISPRAHYITLGALVIIVAALETILARRRKRRAERLTTKILADAIQEQREKLAALGAEDGSAGRARRRAICKTTLLALEERQARILKGGKAE